MFGCETRGTQKLIILKDRKWELFRKNVRRDQLVGITRRNGGNQITDSETIGGYDNNGNPGNYMGNALEWTRGRMLSSCGGITYKYDANGIRTQKTVNGTTHKYYTDNGTLHYETRTKGSSTQKLWYYYDGNGICGIEYNGTAYYFQKNMQGDVTRIFDRNGSLVAQYVYDAWGNHKVLDMSGAENTVETFIGNVNPIRYRGYYYDEESGLYYLQSRYYDPEVGRFINADEVDYIELETLMGCNLYAYCGNNPVMYADPSGHFLVLALVLGAFTVAGMITAGVVGANQGKKGWELFGFIMLGGAVGLAVGGLVVATAGAGAAIFGSAGLATQVLGVAASQAFAIGALAYNFMAIIVAPIVGIEMQPIEWGNPSYTPMKPGETPKHPADRKVRMQNEKLMKMSFQLNQYLISNIVY